MPHVMFFFFFFFFISSIRQTMSVMLIAGGLAGLAGGVGVLGVHYRLIEGFSAGFGFQRRGRSIAGLAQSHGHSWPAGLFIGFLEAGALAYAA